MFNQQSLNVIKYCAEECERQGSGEVSVYDMLNAWNYAFAKFSFGGENLRKERQITTKFISRLGQLVDPIENADGFRTHGIGISTGLGNWKPIGSDWQNIERDLTLLLESYYEGNLGHFISETPPREAKSVEDLFYYEYESIHPFGDGNGRTGKILYNYLCGTLESPIMPPNFFGSSNP